MIYNILFFFVFWHPFDSYGAVLVKFGDTIMMTYAIIYAENKSCGTP